MLEEKDSEIFTLNLNTNVSISAGGFFISSTSTKANSTFQVDFDALFQGRGHLYKKCRVKANLISNSQANSTISSTINEVLGVINLIGLSSTHNLGINGILIGTTFPRSTGVTGTANSHYLVNNWFTNIYGAEIQVPTSKQNIGIQFIKNDGTLMISVPDYLLTLQFELFEKK
jgi:hypothetical protein